MGSRESRRRSLTVMDVRPYTASLWPALERLFGRAGASNGCWCMYWRLGPDYHRRDRSLNRLALRRLGDATPSTGLLAMDGDDAVGWALLAPRRDLPWLDRLPVTRAVDDEPVWAMPCFFVTRERRGSGVTAALLDAGITTAREHGAPSLEAYPVDTDVEGHTNNTFPGIASVFAAAGFSEIARRRPDRPIMRRR